MKPRAFKRIWGKPWDYGYLLKLEQYKIREMCEYLKKHHAHIDWELQVREMTICIKLIDIILEEDKYYLSWLHECYGHNLHRELSFPVYVNIRNYKRFLPLSNPEQFVDNNFLFPHFQVSLRQQKAMYLYNKIRAYCMFAWWD